MIDAKQLRIGNWVFDNFGYPDQITADWFGAFDMELDNVTENTFIPLTYEMLEKCGFVKTNGFIWNTENDGIADIYDKGGFRIHVEVSRGVFYTTQPKSVDYKYVHQLQNLYFALTGTELEINL
jgi:hypothetical protein